MIDIENLIDVNGLKDLVEIQHDMSLKDTLVKKGLTTHQEWAQIMQERIIKNASLFIKKTIKYLFKK
ncbi:MAG TPA: hypothetical protein VFT83_01900 [Nitrososphaeraceae archaeon]|nr:hypothetical protein [Nitrososphaeraceae archaeon]